MAVLTKIIPPQKFEVIRDRLGAVLFDEISNQFTLQGITHPVPTVWICRTVPFNQTDMPAINVSLASGNYNNKDTRGVDGNYLYNVDVYTSLPDTEGSDGDKAAAVRLQFIVGLCRAILENPDLRTLGFPLPFSGQSGVASIAFNDPLVDNEATHITVGRLIYSMRVVEDVQLKDAVPLVFSGTKVKLYNTDKGYQYGYDSDNSEYDHSEYEPIEYN